MIEAALIRRKAIAKGEVGLFAVDAATEEDLTRLLLNETVWAELRNPRNLRLMRLLWALATKLANGGLYLDKDEAMDDLKIRAKWAKFAYDNGRVIIIPKSLTRASGAALSRLADRMIYLVCAEMLPHLRPGELRKEIEAMVGGEGRGLVSSPSRVSHSQKSAKSTSERPRANGRA